MSEVGEYSFIDDPRTTKQFPVIEAGQEPLLTKCFLAAAAKTDDEVESRSVSEARCESGDMMTRPGGWSDVSFQFIRRHLAFWFLP